MGTRLSDEEHRSAEQLQAGLDEIRRSPAVQGTVELIVRRPAENEREILDEGVLDLEQGLVGDMWHDLDLSFENLPAGTQLAVGGAVLEITAAPHTGCAKFSARFGSDALRFVNGATGRPLRLRGVNARVVEPGTVARGDTIARL